MSSSGYRIRGRLTCTCVVSVGETERGIVRQRHRDPAFARALAACEDILVPGLAGWRRERMAELSDTAYFTPPAPAPSPDAA